MGWKNWSYVRKGTIIGLIIGIINIFINITGMAPGFYFYVSTFPITLIIFYFFDKFGVINTGSVVDVVPFLLAIIITTPLNFILQGALIGWIIGKIKNRKKVK